MAQLFMTEAGPHRSPLQRLRSITGVDKAICFSILGRGWSAFAGVLSVTLIAHFLTANEQGYYYTFSSLVGLQIIFELGFSFVILQFTAHERIHLTLHPDGRMEGPEKTKARIASVLQKAVKWYFVASILMTVTLLIAGGHFFMREHPQAAISWKIPWSLLVLCSMVTFQIDPVVSFLEGCGKISEVGRLRLSQGMLGSILAWSALIFHHGLFAPAGVILGQAIAGSIFLRKNRGLLVPLLRIKPAEYSVSWKLEIWPFQWRVAVSWASAYLIWQVINPIVFAYCGPVEAGRLGMSLNIANSLGAVALAWMSTKAAPFGTLIAQGRYTELDRLFFRTLQQSFVMLFVATVGTLLCFPVLVHIFPGFGNRILPFPYFAIVLATMLCAHIVVSAAYYLRAHKKEPFLVFWVAIGLASVITCTLLAKFSGTAGVVVGYFCFSGLARLIAAVYVFYTKRREWHADVPPVAAE